MITWATLAVVSSEGGNPGTTGHWDRKIQEHPGQRQTPSIFNRRSLINTDKFLQSYVLARAN